MDKINSNVNQSDGSILQATFVNTGFSFDGQLDKPMSESLVNQSGGTLLGGYFSNPIVVVIADIDITVRIHNHTMRTVEGSL